MGRFETREVWIQDTQWERELDEQLKLFQASALRRTGTLWLQCSRFYKNVIHEHYSRTIGGWARVRITDARTGKTKRLYCVYGKGRWNKSWRHGWKHA